MVENSVPEISVIVPVYNVQDYLERCLDSVLGQSFPNFEMILVDDGSTDRSGDICDEYAGKDTRIRVIHKANGGLSDARNAGIDVSVGDYLYFLDSDDFISENTLLTLFSLIHEYTADIAVGGTVDCYGNGKTVLPTEELFVLSGKEAVGEILKSNRIAISACNKLFFRNLFQTVRFPVGKTYEDAFVMPEVFFKSSIVAFFTKPLYYYWHHTNSITTKSFNQSAMDVIEAYDHVRELVAQYSPELMSLVEFRMNWAHFVVLDRILMLSQPQALPEYDRMVSYLRNHWKSIVSCKYFSKARRLSAIALKIDIRLYRAMQYIYHQRKESGNE